MLAMVAIFLVIETLNKVYSCEDYFPASGNLFFKPQID